MRFDESALPVVDSHPNRHAQRIHSIDHLDLIPFPFVSVSKSSEGWDVATSQPFLNRSEPTSCQRHLDQ